jgi:glutamine amidotransferase
MSTIAVIDYGMSNLRSVTNAIECVAADQQVVVSDRPEEILAASHVVFPGQGAARDCMRELAAHGLVDVVREAARSRPFLGICMGLQVLLDESDEGDGTPLLGVVGGRVERFSGKDRSGERLKVPQMGWNRVDQTGDHPLWFGIGSGARFYFVHSYRVQPDDQSLVAATTDYGEVYCSALARDNLFAVQFHPEKSHDAGIRLLANFVAWDGSL